MYVYYLKKKKKNHLGKGDSFKPIPERERICMYKNNPLQRLSFASHPSTLRRISEEEKWDIFAHPPPVPGIFI